MVMMIESKRLAARLKTFGRLPKRFSVKVKYQRELASKVSTRTNNHSLVNVQAKSGSVTVVYDSLRNLMQLLPGQSLTFDVRKNGLRILYPNGQFFLKHIEGTWDNTPTINLCELECDSIGEVSTAG